jgi:hypothetical protein
MKDFLGNDLEIGDKVLFANFTGCSAQLKEGVIKTIYEKTCKVNNSYKLIKLKNIIKLNSEKGDYQIYDFRN